MFLLIFFNGLLIVILLLSVRNQEIRKRIKTLEQEITHRRTMLATILVKVEQTRIVYITGTPVQIAAITDTDAGRANTHGDCVADADKSAGYADADCANADGDGDPYNDADSNEHTDTNADGNKHADTDADGNEHADTDADGDLGASSKTQGNAIRDPLERLGSKYPGEWGIQHRDSYLPL